MIDPRPIAALIRHATEAVVLPRFRTLAPEQIREKKPGDFVTVADTECEEMLTRLLTEALPGSLVCGEEAVARDATVLERLHRPAPVWVIDPVDGTSNFAKGSAEFTVIVALVEAGVTKAGWIHDPVNNRTIHATLGGGARDGDRQLQITGGRPLGDLSGSAYGNAPGRSYSAKLLGESKAVGCISNTGCGGIDYFRMAEATRDFKFSSMSLPWDHAAGMLIMKEAGAVARFFDGSTYSVFR
ncbi:MAG: inositol monophosphatase family protein, partial [Rhodospirillaceae bacterium]